MAFPQSFLDELAARNDILDVVGSYVSLQPKGGSYWGCCPFHNEKTPSFHVLQDKQYYHCFGCKKGGGVINFIMDIENLSYPDAVRFLAKRVNMPVPEDRESDGADRLRHRLLDLNRDAARYYYEVLQSPDGAAVQAYLNRRQIRRGIAVRFGMGAARDGWDHLLRAMTEKGYTKQELLKAGLIVQNKSGGFYDKFRNRLILPVVDVRGDVVGFGSRVIDKSEPKYMNTSETPVYSKRRVLYGLNLAKKTKASRFILCEGNVDVIALHQAGFDSAVASCGTALTADQARLMSKYTQEVVICYDADAAGQKATEKAIDILKGNGLAVRVLRLPPRRDAQGRILRDSEGRPMKVDPDDFIKANGAAAFRSLLDKPQTDGQYRMGEIRQKYTDLSDDEQRIAYVKDAVQYIAGVASAVEREIYAHNAAREAGVSPESILTEAERSRRQRQRREERRIQQQALQPEQLLQPKDWSLRYQDIGSAAAEQRLLSTVLGDRQLLEYAALAECASSHPISKSLQKAYGKAIDRSRVTDIQELSGHGVTACVDGHTVAAGNSKLMEQLGIPYHDCHSVGTIIHMAVNGQYAGHIVISDVVKPHAREAIAALHKAGVDKTVMLTGDARKVAESVAAELCVDEVHSDLLPADKVSKVEELLGRQHGKLAFVGDGINDAPVLSRADIGIAMGAMGSDAAIEAADIVLMDDEPLQIAKAIKISRKCIGIVYQNIVFALVIKFACLALVAIGVADMWAAIFADVGVMVLAVLNAIRALRVHDL